jgi:hypothetical protein
MSTGFDPSADFALVADATESVTVERRDAPPGLPGAAVLHALRRAMTAREVAESNGRYVAGDAAWHLPAAELQEPPAVGDRIVDAAGRRFTILAVQEATCGTRWRCAARDLVLAHALGETVTILKAAYTKGDGGAAEAAWSVWKTGVAARIQPVAASVGTQHEAQRTAARYRVFLAEDLALDHAHRIEGPDGTLYRILAVSGAERLGELQTIDVEAIP